MAKRIIDKTTPIAALLDIGGGRYILNAIDGVACTLTGAHHFAGNITHPRQGFREMGVLDVVYEKNKCDKRDNRQETMEQPNLKSKLPKELEGKKFRIRKLTPRECLRLMNVEEQDINTLMNCGLSNSSLYFLAGNSIVVNVLYHIFRKMFVEKKDETQQLSLF